MGDALITGHAHLAIQVVRKLGFRGGTADGEDALTAATLAIVQAGRLFDPARGIPFSAFACQRARWAAIGEIKKIHRHRAVSLDLPAANNDDGGGSLGAEVVDAQADDPAAQAAINEQMCRSSKPQKSIREEVAMKLEHVKNGTPVVEGVPAWATALRESAPGWGSPGMPSS